METHKQAFDIKDMLNVNKLPNLKPRPKSTPPGRPEKETLLRQLKSALGRNGYIFIGLTLCLIYFMICFQGERILRAGTYAVFREIGANGFGVSYSRPKSAYLALKSGIYIDDLVITAPEHMGGWQWKAGRITAAMNPFTPGTVSILLCGTHALSIPSFGNVRLIAGKAEITVTRPTSKTGFTGLLNLENVQVTAPSAISGAKLSNAVLKIERSAGHFENGAAYAYSLIADDLHLPSEASEELPPRVQYVNLTGMLNGFSFKREKPLLNDWLDNSGTVEISRGEIIWKPFMAEFTGTVGFDPSFEIIAASTAKVYGLFDLLERLSKQGFVRPSTLSVAKIVLGSKLKTEPGESQPSLTSPFSIQFGKLYAGQVVLYDGPAETK